jgi:hypothetical protein
MTARRDTHMRESDAFSWYMERDPLLRSTVVSVLVFDRAPDPALLRDKADRASRLVPGLRHRLVEPPLRLAPPRWAVDPDFDLGTCAGSIRPPWEDVTIVLELAASPAWLASTGRPMEFTLSTGSRTSLRRAAATRSPTAPAARSSWRRCSTTSLRRAAPGRARRAGAGATMPPARSPTRACAPYVRLPAVTTGGRRRRARARPRHRGAGLDTVRSVADGRPVATPALATMQRRKLGWHYDVLGAVDDHRPRRHAAHANDKFVVAAGGSPPQRHGARATAPGQPSISPAPDDRPAGTISSRPCPAHRRCGRQLRARADGSASRSRRRFTNAPPRQLLPPAFIGGMFKHVDFLAPTFPASRCRSTSAGRGSSAFRLRPHHWRGERHPPVVPTQQRSANTDTGGARPRRAARASARTEEILDSAASTALRRCPPACRQRRWFGHDSANRSTRSPTSRRTARAHRGRARSTCRCRHLLESPSRVLMKNA